MGKPHGITMTHKPSSVAQAHCTASDFTRAVEAGMPPEVVYDNPELMPINKTLIRNDWRFVKLAVTHYLKHVQEVDPDPDYLEILERIKKAL